MKRRTCIKEKGITLIALVITIIIMLILAGVIISSVTSNKGILSRAKDSREVYDESKAEEQVRLLMNEYAMASAEAGTKGETLTLEDYLKEKKGRWNNNRIRSKIRWIINNNNRRQNNKCK